MGMEDWVDGGLNHRSGYFGVGNVFIFLLGRSAQLSFCRFPLSLAVTFPLDFYKPWNPLQSASSYRWNRQ